MTGELPKTTAIYLTDEEVEQFKLFYKYKEKFDTLLMSGALDTISATVTIHVDKDSNFRRIESTSVLFYR